MTVLAASQALSWLVIAGLCVTVLALARQIGVLHERIAPVGALITDDGPGIGHALPRFTLQDLDGAPAAIGGPSADPRLRLLLFVAADCPICKRLAPIARTLAQAEGIALSLVGDGPIAPLRAMRDRLALADKALADTPFVHGAAIGLALRIGKLPTAVLVDASGTIRGKGLVNSREHLESLLVAHETGHADVQSFLAHRELIHAG